MATEVNRVHRLLPRNVASRRSLPMMLQSCGR